MKQVRYIMSALMVFTLAMFLGLTSFAAPPAPPESPYAGQQFLFSTYGTYSSAQKAQKFGEGIGFQYSANKYFAAELNTTKSEWSHGGLIENLSIGPVLRYPLGSSGLAPYITGGVGFDFATSSSRFYYGGVGAEYRFKKYLSVFAEEDYVFRDVKTFAKDGLSTKAGLRWRF